MKLSSTQFSRLRNLLAQHCGLYLDESRMPQLERAVDDRCAAVGVAQLGEYEELLQKHGGAGEVRLLAELLVNHETQFFRNQPHFRALRDTVLPTLHRRHQADQTLRIWSAGCATGEEAYSLAITALEHFGLPPERTVQIWATDISQPALERAKSGRYRGRTLSNLTQKQITTYFTPVGQDYQLRPEVQRLVQFQTLNLLEPFPPWTQGLDIIFCQNVTIYFQLATSKALIERFFQSLSVGGYLFLGFSETLWGIFDGFETVEAGGGFFYRKPERRPQPARPPTPVIPQKQAQPATAQRPLRTTPQRQQAPTQTPRAQQAQQKAPISGMMEQAWLMRANGQQVAALEHLRSAIPAPHELPAMLALVAWLHADLGEWDQAAAEARRALELDLLQEHAHLLLGMLEMQSGAWQHAVQHLERVIYLNPSAPVPSFHAAECYRHLGRADQAAREYRNTLNKLAQRQPTEIIDGVTVAWLRESCQRWLNELARTRQR